MTQSGSNPNNAAAQQSAVPQQQMVPARPGNPRFTQPGLDPSPDPKVVVKAVNPPITPDQVVSMAEIPEAATIDLPKIQNIKIPPVQNKTIQGHLKAIEAKMIATEKLMKDIVKLQKVQIHTEKELFERKRELYQNTFEEYLLDKTIDFEDPDNPDCTCINLPKKPGPPGGGFNPPNKPKPPKPPKPPTGGAPVTELPDWTNGIDLAALAAALGITIAELIRLIISGGLTPQMISQNNPGVITNPSLLPKVPEPVTTTQQPGLDPSQPKTAVLPTSGGKNPPMLPGETDNDYWLRTGEYPDTETQRPSFFDNVTAQAGKVFNGFLNPETPPEFTAIENALGLSPGTLMMAIDMASMSMGTGIAVQGANKLPVLKKLFQLPAPAKAFLARRFPALKRLLGLADDVPTGGSAPIAKQRLIKDLKKGNVTGAADDVAGAADDIVSATTTSNTATKVIEKVDDVADVVIPRTTPTGGLTARELARRRALMRGGSRNPNINRNRMTRSTSVKDRINKNLNRRVDTAADDLANTADLSSRTTAGGMRGKNDALRDFLQDVGESGAGTAAERQKAVEFIEEIVKPGLKDITPKSGGGMGNMELHNSSALNYFKGISNKITPLADGGLLGGLTEWWNRGRNTRVPNESNARWRGPNGLLADDARQLTRTDKAFKSGAGGIKGWRPLKAFTPDMVRTGPTPAVRQAFERPVRAVGRGINPSSAVNPLALFAELIINELVNPAPTSSFDQVTGPNAYYNMPGYNGPMPSQSLENAQGSMMSNSDNDTPDVIPLPPDYIQLPTKKKDVNFVGDESPNIDIEKTIFSRSSSYFPTRN